MGTLLDNFNRYLANTSREQIEKDWAETERFDAFGPTVDEYLKFVEEMNKNKIQSFTDVYKMPFKYDDFAVRMYDSMQNFVAEFDYMRLHDSDCVELVKIINGEPSEYDLSKYKLLKSEDGCIVDEKDEALITIRGWGNLTGTSAMNLPADQAELVQDTLLNYIYAQLINHQNNGRK